MLRNPAKGREDPLPRATSYSVKLEQRIEEALIAIRLDCWDYRKKLNWTLTRDSAEDSDTRLIELAKRRLDQD